MPGIYKLNRCYIKLSLVNILENVFVFIEILFKMLLFKGGVLIYAEHCIYIIITHHYPVQKHHHHPLLENTATIYNGRTKSREVNLRPHFRSPPHATSKHTTQTRSNIPGALSCRVLNVLSMNESVGANLEARLLCCLVFLVSLHGQHNLLLLSATA